MAGGSTFSYTYEDHFAADTDIDGNTVNNLIEADPISAMQFKGGAMYDFMSTVQIRCN